MTKIFLLSFFYVSRLNYLIERYKTFYYENPISKDHMSEKEIKDSMFGFYIDKGSRKESFFVNSPRQKFENILYGDLDECSYDSAGGCISYPDEVTVKETANIVNLNSKRILFGYIGIWLNNNIFVNCAPFLGKFGSSCYLYKIRWAVDDDDKGPETIIKSDGKWNWSGREGECKFYTFSKMTLFEEEKIFIFISRIFRTDMNNECIIRFSKFGGNSGVTFDIPFFRSRDYIEAPSLGVGFGHLKDPMTGKKTIFVALATSDNIPQRTGELFIFISQASSSSDPSFSFEIYYTITNEHWPICSYFGTHILSIDINKDENIDLISSASMSSKDDVPMVGAFHLFINRKEHPHFNKNSIIVWGEKIPRSQFAWKVEYAGDLNFDSYPDFFVAALKSSLDDSKGIIYIFFGRSSIDSGYNYEDKILPEETWASSNFLGFGFQIYSGKDFNKDGFNDFVISNIFDSKVVLYHRIPFVKYQTSFNLIPNEIVIDENSAWGDDTPFISFQVTVVIQTETPLQAIYAVNVKIIDTINALTFRNFPEIKIKEFPVRPSKDDPTLIAFNFKLKPKKEIQNIKIEGIVSSRDPDAKPTELLCTGFKTCPEHFSKKFENKLKFRLKYKGIDCQPDYRLELQGGITFLFKSHETVEVKLKLESNNLTPPLHVRVKYPNECTFEYKDAILTEYVEMGGSSEFLIPLMLKYQEKLQFTNLLKCDYFSESSLRKREITYELTDIVSLESRKFSFEIFVKFEFVVKIFLLLDKFYEINPDVKEKVEIAYSFEIQTLGRSLDPRFKMVLSLDLSKIDYSDLKHVKITFADTNRGIAFSPVPNNKFIYEINFDTLGKKKSIKFDVDISFDIKTKENFNVVLKFEPFLDHSNEYVLGNNVIQTETEFKIEIFMIKNIKKYLWIIILVTVITILLCIALAVIAIKKNLHRRLFPKKEENQDCLDMDENNAEAPSENDVAAQY